MNRYTQCRGSFASNGSSIGFHLLNLLLVSSSNFQCSNSHKNVGDASEDAYNDIIDVDTDEAHDADDDVVDAMDSFDGAVDTILDTLDDFVLDIDTDTALDCDDSIPIFPSSDCFAYWDSLTWTLSGRIELTGSDEPYSLLQMMSVHDREGPSSTGEYVIDTWIPMSACDLCIAFYDTCFASTGCEYEYIASHATLTITDFSRGLGGSVSGSLANAYFVEWDSATDSLVTDGLGFCVGVWTFDERF